mgnify:CR=1 FL=1
MKLFSVNGAFENVVLWNSGSVVHPVPSGREPELFFVWFGCVLILFILDAKLFRSDFASCLICCFSRADISRHSDFVMFEGERKCL